MEEIKPFLTFLDHPGVKHIATELNIIRLRPPSPSSLPSFLCVVCACVSACLHRFACAQAVCLPVDVRGWHSLSSSASLHFSFWDKISQGTWSLPSWLGWLLSDLPGSVPGLALQTLPPYLALYLAFMWVLEIWLRCPCLCGKHFAHWAKSSVWKQFLPSFLLSLPPLSLWNRISLCSPGWLELAV